MHFPFIQLSAPINFYEAEPLSSIVLLANHRLSVYFPIEGSQGQCHRSAPTEIYEETICNPKQIAFNLFILAFIQFPSRTAKLPLPLSFKIIVLVIFGTLCYCHAINEPDDNAAVPRCRRKTDLFDFASLIMFNPGKNLPGLERATALPPYFRMRK